MYIGLVEVSQHQQENGQPSYEMKHDYKYDLETGQVMKDDVATNFTDAVPKQGDVIGLRVNKERGNVQFSLNKDNLGTAFQGLELRDQVYPFVIL